MKFLWKSKRQGIMTSGGLQIEGYHILFRSDHLTYYWLTGLIVGKYFIGVVSSERTEKEFYK